MSELLDGARGFLASNPLPELDISSAVVWHRHGLTAIHQRTEQLKVHAAQAAWVAEQTAIWQGRLRSLLIDLRAEEDAAIGGPDFASRVGVMASRGLAYEERRIQHQTRAITQSMARRQAEKVLAELDARADQCRTRSFLIRDERSDLRTQVRGIDIGLQIGEL